MKEQRSNSSKTRISSTVAPYHLPKNVGPLQNLQVLIMQHEEASLLYCMLGRPAWEFQLLWEKILVNYIQHHSTDYRSRLMMTHATLINVINVNHSKSGVGAIFAKSAFHWSARSLPKASSSTAITATRRTRPTQGLRAGPTAPTWRKLANAVSAVWKIEQNRWVGMDVKGWVEPLIIVHHHLYIFNHIYTWYYMVHLPSYPRLRCTSLRSSGSTWGAMDRKRQFPPAPQRWNLAVVEALTKWKSEVQICSQHVEMTVHVLHFHIAVYIQSACCCTCSLRVCVRAQLTASSLWPLSCGYHPCRSRMLFKISWPSSRDSRDHLPRNHIPKTHPSCHVGFNVYINIYII